MSELNRRARDLIASLDDSDGPTDAERARLRAALLARVGAGAVAGAAGAKAAAVASHAAAAPLSAVGKLSFFGAITKGIAVIAVVGVGSAAYVALKASSEASTRTTAPATAVAVSPPAHPTKVAQRPAPPVPVPESRDLPPAAATPLPSPAVQPSDKRAATVAPVSSPPPPADSLATEAADLGAAVAALRDGHAASALSMLDDQDSRYAQGALREERAAMRGDALCALGKVDQATASATAFLHDHPRSLLAPKVRLSCGVKGTP
jgi:type IV secretory pathway VirB10-like protein